MKSFFTDFEPVKTLTPKTAAEVQEIIKKANRDKTPLVPVSSGCDLQDTHLPTVKGAFAVDLSGLKGMYFDAANRNLTVEPGVTFADVEKLCAKAGLRTLTAIDVSKRASILSTYLEMMPLYQWPKYHPWEMLTMEGYRADGERFATGQMAMVQDRPDKYSWGVSFAMVARLYCMAQGTLGIITKAAVTLKTAMEETEVLYYPCTTIAKATQALKAFLFTEEPHEIFAVNKAEITYKKQDAAEIAKQLGGSLMSGLRGFKNASKTILAEIASPTGAALHTARKSWAPIVCIATAEQIASLSGAIPKASGSILMPLQAGGCFYYQPDLRFAEGDFMKTRKEYVAICEKMLKAGVLFPRPSALIAKQVSKQYPDSFNVLKSIKRAVDPKNIMNPGKLGL